MAYPGGMHRMHVHPPSPPLCIPPPAMCIPSPLPRSGWLWEKMRQWALGNKKKVCYCDLIIFCRVSLYIKKQKGFGEHTIQSVFETLRCCWETNNSRQPALPQTKCSEGCCISFNRWKSAKACWHAYTHTSSCMCKVSVVLYFLCYLFKLLV